MHTARRSDRSSARSRGGSSPGRGARSRPVPAESHAARCAASLVWLAGQINGGLFWRGRRSSAWVWKWFGVAELRRTRSQSRPRRQGSTRRYASPSQGWAVGEPTLLTSRYRSALIRERERLLDIAEHRRTWRITEADECVERIEVRVESTTFVSAAKGVLHWHRASHGDRWDSVTASRTRSTWRSASPTRTSSCVACSSHSTRRYPDSDLHSNMCSVE